MLIDTRNLYNESTEPLTTQNGVNYKPIHCIHGTCNRLLWKVDIEMKKIYIRCYLESFIHSDSAAQNILLITNYQIKLLSFFYLNVGLDVLCKVEIWDLRNIATSFLYKCRKILTYNEKCLYIIWQLQNLDRKSLVLESLLYCN